VVLTQTIEKVVKLIYIEKMEITTEQYEAISELFPKHRGNVGLDNLAVLNAVLYVLENGCKWRRLPKEFGNWHTIYTRISRWAKAGVLDRVFCALQEKGFLQIRIEAVSLDSTYIKVHPDGAGALKKTVGKASASLKEDGPVKFIWLPQVLSRL